MASGEYENLRLRSLQNTRNDLYFVSLSLKKPCSGERTVSHDGWGFTQKVVQDKVLSDERSTAFVTTIEDINRWWLECKECNWYKSRQSILTEAR